LPLLGDELAAFQLPAALRSVTADPGEHCLYLGSGDGRIFEVSLLRGGDAGNNGGGGGGSSRFEVLDGHSAAVTALSMTADGTQLVSGVRCTEIAAPPQVRHVPED